MSIFILGALSVLIVTNEPAATSNLVAKPVALATINTNDLVEKDFQKVMEEDDAAQAEVDKWIRDNQAFAAKGAGEPEAELNKRILARLETTRKIYDDFLAAHPDHARAHLAYAGFLQDIRDEDAAVPHMEKARELDPKNPAAWNNLANYYGHEGELKKAFEYYAKAIELNPNEPVYYHNFGTTVYLFRKDAKEFYNINEQQVFDKALGLYARALKLNPTDFPLATDVAQSYYGIRPLRAEDALKSWTNALAVARDDIEREGVYLHFARINWMAGRTKVAQTHLNSVTNAMYAELKKRLERNLERTYVESKEAEVPPPATGKSSANKTTPAKTTRE